MADRVTSYLRKARVRRKQVVQKSSRPVSISSVSSFVSTENLEYVRGKDWDDFKHETKDKKIVLNINGVFNEEEVSIELDWELKYCFNQRRKGLKYLLRGAASMLMGWKSGWYDPRG